MPAYDPYEEYDTYAQPGWTPDRYSYNTNRTEGLAPGYGNAVAFDEPNAEGLRYPIATPRSGSWEPPAPAPRPEFTSGGARILYGTENMPALPGGGINEAYAAEQRGLQGDNQQATQQAIRLQGLMEFQALTRGGMDSAEAIRKVAPKLYFNAPQATELSLRPPKVSQIKQLQPPQMITNPDGSKYVTSPGGGWQYVAPMKAPAVPKEVQPLDQKTALKTAEGDISAAQKALVFATTSPSLLPRERPAAIDAARTALEQAKAAQSNIVRQAMQPRGDKVMPPPSEDVAEPTVTSKAQFDALPKGATYTGRDGRKYRKP
jgi:hypothetical protein